MNTSNALELGALALTSTQTNLHTASDLRLRERWRAVLGDSENKQQGLGNTPGAPHDLVEP